MRFIEYLIEAEKQIGVVVSTHNGRFYDINFVDYNTLFPLAGHNANIGKRFIRYVQENDLWQYVPEFFAKNSSFQGKPLGEEYSSEDADFILYGPMSPQQLNMLQYKFEEQYGYEI